MVRRLSSLTKYTAHMTTILFIAGFVFDMIVLPDIDHFITRFIGFGHICIVAFFLMFREWIVSRNTASLFEQKIYSLSSFLISFSSGAALSFICVYAIRSATFSVSWPLFLILLICIIANEFVNTHNFRLTLDVGILLIALVFFSIFNIPLFTKAQNDNVFIGSIILAMVISLMYVYFLQFTSESARHEASRNFALAIGVPMFVGMLYFLNVIPAVPLSLKDSGVYHKIERGESGDFIFSEKKKDASYLSFLKTDTHYYVKEDDGVYFYSAIDAPAEITAPISHVWEQYDESTKKWSVSSIVTFDIIGGRKDGYRAYSKKENITSGIWRVTVKVGDNRVIGRKKFEVATF